jgi:cation diffusion facilitator CzcD-associated flavoprotein CzcO
MTAAPHDSAQHVDVLIVGAGISGVGAAYHLQQQCPDRSYLVLEALPDFGGTWYTHRYPGIRSDSDLFTFGYRFKPWTAAPIATAAQIRRYLGEVIEENGIGDHIRYRHKIVSAQWHSESQRWTLQVRRGDSGETVAYSCHFLWMCQGYYRHGAGYTPEWPGMADFQGRVVHPQTWPEDLPYAGKRVVVIGSGATAATLIPAIADACAHVTMLQRSPTYFRTAANANEMADLLRPLGIPQEWTHEIVRRKVLADQAAFTRRARDEPDAVRRELVDNVRNFIGKQVDVDKHFAPRYRPWQQRLAFIPDADLFKAIAAGKASVLTDEIECFTARGLKLKSGAELEADIIVTATGFHLSALGDIPFTVDGKPLDFHQTVTYRGTMFTGLPNLAWMFGYLRASWTLRVDLLSDFTCRLLNHMRHRGAGVVVPQLREKDTAMPLKPWVEADNFNAGYMMRSLHVMPQQGSEQPWKLETDYFVERELLPLADLDDGALRFVARRAGASAAGAAAADVLPGAAA